MTPCERSARSLDASTRTMVVTCSFALLLLGGSASRPGSGSGA